MPGLRFLIGSEAIEIRSGQTGTEKAGIIIPAFCFMTGPCRQAIRGRWDLNPLPVQEILIKKDPIY
jgi:hypothetical protein